MPSTERVARYYDRNTRRFLRFGGGSDALAIHRELWAPGVRDAAAAKRHVNRLLADEIADRCPPRPTILDLGCGVGGTLFDLAARFPEGRLHGVTVSREQVAMATVLTRRRGLERRCFVHPGDFERLELPAEHEGLRADAVVAVESFAHARDATAFFRTARTRLRGREGVLLLVDDFLTAERDGLDTERSRIVGAFEAGWRLGTLRTPEDVARTAEGAGLELLDDRDLTPLVRLGRPRDLMIRALAPMLSRAGLTDVPFFGNMVGGNALQDGLRRGVLTYRMLVLGASGAKATR